MLHEAKPGSRDGANGPPVPRLTTQTVLVEMLKDASRLTASRCVFSARTSPATLFGVYSSVGEELKMLIQNAVLVGRNGAQARTIR